MVVGSVADKIVRGSVVPVLIEPGTDEPKPPSPNRPVLVGLDGSDEAERGLAAARALGLPVVILRTYSIPPPVGIEFATYPADLATTLEDAAKAYLAGVAKSGEKTILRQGDATTAILEAAEELDASLIVLTSTGKGLTKRVALGSTTDRVIHGTQRPVLVIPRAG
jgi:nucleotide-binding universal stress UspA family protein